MAGARSHRRADRGRERTHQVHNGRLAGAGWRREAGRIHVPGPCQRAQPRVPGIAARSHRGRRRRLLGVAAPDVRRGAGLGPSELRGVRAHRLPRDAARGHHRGRRVPLPASLRQRPWRGAHRSRAGRGHPHHAARRVLPARRPGWQAARGSAALVLRRGRRTLGGARRRAARRRRRAHRRSHPQRARGRSRIDARGRGLGSQAEGAAAHAPGRATGRGRRVPGGRRLHARPAPGAGRHPRPRPDRDPRDPRQRRGREPARVAPGSDLRRTDHRARPWRPRRPAPRPHRRRQPAVPGVGLQLGHRRVGGGPRPRAGPASSHGPPRDPRAREAARGRDRGRNALSRLGRGGAEAGNAGRLCDRAAAADGLEGPRRGLPDLLLLGPRRHTRRGRRKVRGRKRFVRRLYNIGRLVTGAEEGVIAGAAIIFEGDRIAWCGHEGSEPRVLMDTVSDDYDCGGGLVTAGLIDAHTHPLYAGERLAEVAMRAEGRSYTEIAKAGGGIKATVKSTRGETSTALEAAGAQRLAQWFDGGATTVEAKTGYHLNRDGELAAVRILKRLSDRDDVPRIEVTFLAAHAMPPDKGASHAGYANQVARWCVDARAAGARFCDVFCDSGYFTVGQSRKILQAAVDAKLIPRIHADELARTGGARLAAELHAASADHLLCADRSDAKAMARAGVVATLCPVTALSMGKLPPVKQFVDSGTVIALGTDHNPGTSGITSMSQVVALAIGLFKMSASQALLAATVGSAQSLDLTDRGKVKRSLLADVVLWDADHEGGFAWAFGLAPRQVWKGGSPIE